MLKRLTPVVGAMLLTLATYAAAQELAADHPDTYTVQKGDTLWDISAKFLAKPWLWPEIWQANPQVKDPHRIYPGDVLSLHYVNGQPRIEVATDGGPQIRVGEAVDTVPLSQIEPWLKHLTVVQDPKSFPYVIGLEEDHLMAGTGQLVYVRNMPDAKPGDLVQVARPMNLYALNPPRDGYRTGGHSPLNKRADMLSEPWTFGTWSNGDEPEGAWGQKLGYEMQLQSIGEVTRVQGDITSVLLRDENRDVRVGDRILPVEAQPYCNCFTPHPAAAIPEGARVLAVPDGLRYSGPRMVVALSLGTADGIDNGTVFSIWRGGSEVVDDVRNWNEIAAYHDSVVLPDEYVGHVMVFRTFDHVSYGLVMDTIEQVRNGYFLKHPDAVN
jgi:hypothetical protein